ncbi:protein charlatan isoform X2 [Ixodes scapularis]|uniref:protein charlatan isoform X2 n=1 Tax=Ixodes scapularis TaxID=6945 RepID=UPI001C38536B|nr:protein charlatan isoform X2 [Ixodes scapularis]
MDKGTLNAAFSCLEGIYTNQNVGKHVSALLQASRNSASHFLPPYPLFPPLAPPGAMPAPEDCAKKAHQPQQQQQQQQQQHQHHHARVPTSGASAKSERKSKRDLGTSSNDGWVQGQEKFSWDGSPVAAYNPATKMFRCVACNTLGFLSRIAEHYLGTHVNAKQVFQCPECPYSSAWSRCVRLHLGKVHGIQNAPASLWRDQPLLDEILGILQNLKNLAEASNGSGLVAAPATPGSVAEKRYVCPRCPYATDRRDLYHRHENIHKDDKPFHCYVCFKLFNRADHVKKHFLRIHKNHPYDIGLIRRHPPRTGSSHASPVASSHGPSTGQNGQWALAHSNVGVPRLPTGSCGAADCSGVLPGTNGCSAGGAQSWGFHNSPSTLCGGSGGGHGHVAKVPGCLGAAQEGAAKGKRGAAKAATSGGSAASAAAKTFACAYCPWRGVDGWCLRRHLNTHIKPFSCPFCEYKAARSERLNTHVLKVHGKHLCNKCHFAGEDSIALERHIKENHLSSSLNDKSRMGCSLYPPFPVRAPHPPAPQPVDKCKVEPCGCSTNNGTSACSSNPKTQLGHRPCADSRPAPGPPPELAPALLAYQLSSEG